MPKRLFVLLLFLIIVVAVFLRFFRLGQIPVSLYWDETAILVDAGSVAQSGLDMHGNHWLQPIFISYGDYKLPVYIWLAALTVKLFGISEFSLRLPSAIAGVLTMLLGGLIARELFTDGLSQLKKKTRNLYFSVGYLAVALVIAVSPWSVVFSRAGFEGHLGQFIFGLAVFFLLLDKRKWYFLYLAQILAVLSTYTYFSIRFIWPVVMLAYFLVLRKRFNWQFLLKILSAFAIYFLILMPMIRSPLYEASNQFRLSTTSVLNMEDWAVKSNQYRQLAGNSLIDRLVYHRFVLQGRELLKNYGDNISFNFLFINGDPNLRHGTSQHGLFLLVFAPAFLVGLYKLFDGYKPQLFFLVIWWLASLLPASVPETTPHALRSLNALLPLSIIIGLGLAYLVKEGAMSSQKHVYRRWKVFSLIGYGLLIVVAVIQFSWHYFAIYPQQSAAAWQDGFKELAIEIEAKRDPVRTVWVDIADDRFYLWLLASGNYTQQDFRSWQWSGYTLDKVENIEFRQFDWLKLDSLDHKIMVVGRKNEMESRLESIQQTPSWTQTVGGKTGVERFMMAGFGQ